MMKVEIRSNSVRVEGYVNAVGRDSRVMTDVRGGKFVEQVPPGTFQRAINSGGNIEIRANHEYCIGSLRQGNLSLKEDSIGLYAKADIADSAVMAAAAAGNLRGWSFGFRKKKDHFEPTGRTGLERRFLDEIDLFEVSVLTNKSPAYCGTSIEARAGDDELIEIRSFLQDDDIEVVGIRSDSEDKDKHGEDVERESPEEVEPAGKDADESDNDSGKGKKQENNADEHADDEKRAIFYAQLETELEILRLRRG